ERGRRRHQTSQTQTNQKRWKTKIEALSGWEARNQAPTSLNDGHYTAALSSTRLSGSETFLACSFHRSEFTPITRSQRIIAPSPTMPAMMALYGKRYAAIGGMKNVSHPRPVIPMRTPMGRARKVDLKAR